jgi:chaperone BCS1
MSANHPERLDPALLRPGRVDKVIRFGRASFNTVDRIVGQYFPGEEVGVDDSFDRTLTPAEVIRSCTEARCAEEAMDRMRANAVEDA